MNAFQKILLLALFFLFFLPAHAQINLSVKNIQSEVEMVWESSSYIPPFYKGKALYPVGGDVTVLAFPPESLGDPDALTYVWKRDGLVQGDVSGPGERSFTYTDNKFGAAPLIIVEVSNGTKKVFGAFRLTPEQPTIRFYENRPLEGVIFEKAFPKKITRDIGDLNIEAYPYFFSTNTRFDEQLLYTWTANSTKLVGATGPSMLIQNEQPQLLQLGLSINNQDRLLQRATENTTAVFE